MVLLGEVMNGKTWKFSRTILSKGERRSAVTRYVKLQKTHEKDLDYKEQLLRQKPQASLNPQELAERRSVVALLKASVTPSKRAVID